MTNFSQQHQLAKQHSRQIEAILHASESPIEHKKLRQFLDVSDKQLHVALGILQERLSLGALQLSQSPLGYRLQIRDEFSPLIAQIFPERREHLSQALLETLSVIAYKQPVTRADIEQVRGVSVSSGVLRQLFDKGWIVERGHKDTLGRPALLCTTNVFLDAFGLMSLDELPPLPQLTSVALETLQTINNDNTKNNQSQ